MHRSFVCDQQICVDFYSFQENRKGNKSFTGINGINTFQNITLIWLKKLFEISVNTSKNNLHMRAI